MCTPDLTFQETFDKSRTILLKLDPALEHLLKTEVIIQDILHWNYKGLIELPQVLLEHGSHVRAIYMRSNRLQQLPSDLSRLRSLTILHLPSNCLKDLPEGLGVLASLEILDVGCNNLTLLPHSIGGLVHLKRLMADHNNLRTLPEEIGELKRLVSLQLSSNKISSLPSSLGRCTNLVDVALDENLLKQLPRSVLQLPSLQEVWVCRNRLLYLPAVASASGAKLYFHSNPTITYLPYHFRENVVFAGTSDLLWRLGNYGCFEENVIRSDHIQVEASYKTALRRVLTLPQDMKKLSTKPEPVCLSEICLRHLWANFPKRFLEPMYPCLPVSLSSLLDFGPTSVCVGCGSAIFQHTFLSIVLRYLQARPLETGTPLFVIKFMCSHSCCQTSADAMSAEDKKLFEHISWKVVSS